LPTIPYSNTFLRLLQPPTVILNIAFNSNADERADLSIELERLIRQCPSAKEVIFRGDRAGWSPVFSDQPRALETLPTSHVDVYVVTGASTYFAADALDEIAGLLLAHPGHLYIHCGLTWRAVYSAAHMCWYGWEATLRELGKAKPGEDLDALADIPLLLSLRLRYKLPKRSGSDQQRSLDGAQRSALDISWIEARMKTVRSIGVEELKSKKWYGDVWRPWVPTNSNRVSQSANMAR
jgi:hypothetical protein